MEYENYDLSPGDLATEDFVRKILAEDMADQSIFFPEYEIAEDRRKGVSIQVVVDCSKSILPYLDKINAAIASICKVVQEDKNPGIELSILGFKEKVKVLKDYHDDKVPKIEHPDGKSNYLAAAFISIYRGEMRKKTFRAAARDVNFHKGFEYIQPITVLIGDFRWNCTNRIQPYQGEDQVVSFFPFLMKKMGEKVAQSKLGLIGLLCGEVEEGAVEYFVTDAHLIRVEMPEDQNENPFAEELEKLMINLKASCAQEFRADQPLFQTDQGSIIGKIQQDEM